MPSKETTDKMKEYIAKGEEAPAEGEGKRALTTAETDKLMAAEADTRVQVQRPAKRRK